MVAFLVLLLAHPACGTRADCKVVRVAEAGPGLEVAQVVAAGTGELWVVARGRGKARTTLLATGSFDAEPFDPDAVAIEVGPNRLGITNAVGGMCPSQSRTAFALDPPAWVASSHAETGACEVIRRFESHAAADPGARGVRVDLAVMRSEKCPDLRAARYAGIPRLEIEDGAWRTATLGVGAFELGGSTVFKVRPPPEPGAPVMPVRAAVLSSALLLVDVPPGGVNVDLWIGALASEATRFRLSSDGSITRVAGAERSAPSVERVVRADTIGLAVRFAEPLSADTMGLTVGAGGFASSEVCHDEPATLGALGRRLPARVANGKIEAIVDVPAFEPLVLKRARLAGHRWQSPVPRSMKPSPARETTLLIAGEATLDRVEWETRAKVSELPAKPTEDDWGTDVVVALPRSAGDCVTLLENLGWRERLTIKGKARRLPLTNDVARTRIEFESATCAK